MTSFNRQYSFPNVNVYETVRGPQPFTSVWRNTIGIAAPFSKGPLLAQISSREEFANLFGEDNSLGAVAVRQAMMQGATNLILSRVVPQPKGAAGTISLANPQSPATLEPVIGSTDNRTVGLSVDFSFISDVIAQQDEIIAYAYGTTNTRAITPEINTTDFLDSLDFDGIGSLSLVKVNTLSETSYDYFLRKADTLSTVSTVELIAEGFEAITSSNINKATTGETIFKVIFPKTALPNDRYVEAFVPGMRIKAAAEMPEAPAVYEGITFANDYGIIVSELEHEDFDNYSFYVKAEVTAVGTDTSIKLEVPEGFVEPVGETPAVYPILDVFRLFFIPNSTEYLPGDIKYFGKPDDSNAYSQYPIGYFVFDRKNNPGDTLPISYYVINNGDESTLSLVYTGVTYKVGLASDASVSIMALNQTINIAKTTVEVGETDTSLTDFNTPRAFVPNQSVTSVLRLLRQELLSNTVLTVLNANVTVDSANYPFTLTISLGVEGVIGNNLQYRVKRIGGGTLEDIIFKDGEDNLFYYAKGTSEAEAKARAKATLNFLGGVDEITPASRIFYNRYGRPVVLIEALSPGVSGNNISVNIRPVDDRNFTLEVRELVAVGRNALPTESYYLSNTTVDLTTGIYPETLNSKLIKAYYIPVLDASGSGSDVVDFNQSPVRIAPPDYELGSDQSNLITHSLYMGLQYTQNIRLVGGREPVGDTELLENAYIDAIDRLADQDVSFLIAPGLVAGDVRYTKAISALIQQANQATPSSGLRIAVLAAPPRLTPSRAEILNSQYSSPNLVIVGGWSSVVTIKGLGINRYSPEGFYVGSLAVTDTYISPASSYNNTYVNGVGNLDTDTRLDSLDAFTNNNIEMMYVDKVVGKVKFLNGRTTAGDLNNRWVSIKRQSQHLIMNIVKNLRWALSAPNDPETRSRVASAVDALLKTEQRRGAIAGFTPSSINSSNQDRIAQGYMDIVITWTPIFPADYINVELIRTVSNQFSLQLG